MHKDSRVKSDNDWISVSLERFLGYVRDDDTGKGYPQKVWKQGWVARDEWLGIRCRKWLACQLMASPLFMLRGAFRHPERSEMSDVRSCKGGTVRTESKDLAPHHHFAFLISHFSFKRSFHTESKGAPPHGLTLNPEPVPSFHSLFPLFMVIW